MGVGPWAPPWPPWVPPWASLGPPWPPPGPPWPPPGPLLTPLRFPRFSMGPSVPLASFHVIRRGPPYLDFAIKSSCFFNISGTPRNYETSPREKKRGSWAPPGPPRNSARRPEGGRGPPRKTTKITRGGPGPPRGSKFSRKSRPGPPPGALWRFFKNVVFPKEKHTC